MFIIKSYIQHPKRLIYDFEKVKKDPFYYFIDIDNAEKILQIKKDLDLDYIYGVLFFVYNNQVIIDYTYYDLIDQLWAYFLNMMKECLENKKSEMSFPDQPLPMSMHDMPDGYILFSINFIQWKLPKYEFFDALLFGAKYFFEKMILLIEEEKEYYVFQLNKIKVLEKQINTLGK